MELLECITLDGSTPPLKENHSPWRLSYSSLGSLSKSLESAFSRSCFCLVMGEDPSLLSSSIPSMEQYFQTSFPPILEELEARGALLHTSKKRALFLFGGAKEREFLWRRHFLASVQTREWKDPPITTHCLLLNPPERKLSSLLSQMKEEKKLLGYSLHSRWGVMQLDLFGQESLFPYLKNILSCPIFQELSLEHAIHSLFKASGKTLGAAESCSGGALASRLTSLPGASLFFQGSVVSYANQWKETWLHVSSSILEEKGAVSAPCVEAMVQGILRETKVDYALALSGIAGPSGGTPQKPVGTLFIGLGGTALPFRVEHFLAPPRRSAMIEFAVTKALSLLLEEGRTDAKNEAL